MDLGVLVSELNEFCKKYNLSFSKADIKPWGSYDLVLHISTQQGWLHTAETYGWGWTLDEAIAKFLIKVGSLSDFEGSIYEQYIGSQPLTELRDLVKKNNNNLPVKV